MGGIEGVQKTAQPLKGPWAPQDYDIYWTDEHLPREVTDPLKQRCDTLGDQALQKLQEISKANKGDGDDNPMKMDAFALLEEHHASDPILEQLWTRLNAVPDWVDWEQIKRGQPFFYRYAFANVIGFALQGFVGENSSVPAVGAVLVCTGGFATRRLFRRLLETFQWLLEVTDGSDTLKPGGHAWRNTIRVRFMHCFARIRILKIAENRPVYYDSERLGLPANSLDSIHSITTFSTNPMYLQLPQMNVYPTQQEIEDYLAVFRYLAYLLGTPTDFFTSAAKTKAVFESLLLHEVTEPTEACSNLGYNFLQVTEDLPPAYFSADLLVAGSRIMCGDKTCDSLGLVKPGWVNYAEFRALSWLLGGLALLQQNIPPFDRYMTKLSRDMLHKYVIHSPSGLQGGSKFGGFDYVPREGKQHTVKADSGRTPPSGFIKRPVQKALLMLFIGRYIAEAILAAAIVLPVYAWLAPYVYIGAWSAMA